MRFLRNSYIFVHFQNDSGILLVVNSLLRAKTQHTTDRGKVSYHNMFCLHKLQIQYRKGTYTLKRIRIIIYFIDGYKRGVLLDGNIGKRCV